MNSKDINKYLYEVAKLLKEDNLYDKELVIVGGAAVALRYRFSRSTEDIDICMWTDRELYSKCLIVKEKYGLDDEWINGRVVTSPSFSSRLLESIELYKDYEGVLRVYTISDLNLFCMKIVSFRQKDIQDLDRIGKRLKRYKITRDMMMQRFIYLYEGMYNLDTRRIKYISSIWGSRYGREKEKGA